MENRKYRGYNEGWHYGYYVRTSRSLINGELAINLYQCEIANFIVYDEGGELKIVEIVNGSLGQSTGLKDTNKVEIFTGDIFGEFDFIGEQAGKMVPFAKVIFDDDLGAYAVEQANGGWEYLYDFLHNEKRAEIIGNIHEDIFPNDEEV
jgi:uncharacterized phage protein (TIGR01671 family)